MKILVRFLVIVPMLVLAATTAPAQVEDLGIHASTLGKDFRVVVPMVYAHTTEKPLPQPVSLFLSSPTKTKVRIKSDGEVMIDREITVEADEVYKFSVPLPMMLDESSTIADRVVQVTSDRPISVSVFMAWNGNGELMHITPTHVLGERYRTANTFMDAVLRDDGWYRPGRPMAIVVGASDSTTVEIQTKRPLEEGPDVEMVEEGHYRLALNENQAVLLLWEFEAETYKTWESDPSGTLITSDKPIGVYSGATKNAIMRMPDKLPPTGMFSSDAHFVRNCLFEAVPPTSLSGTHFITVPALYTTSRITLGHAANEVGLDNDSGDVVRVLALEDETIVRRSKGADGGWDLMATLQAGESYLDTVAGEEHLWSTSAPCQVWQYGKSYAKVLPPKVETPKGEKPQLHPTVESGMPMMMNVPSLDHFISYGVFTSPEGMDNFMNIVLNPDDVNKIKIDGRSLGSAYGGSMRTVPGTQYSYIRTSVGAGDHVIESDSSDILWSAWTYGSIDGLSMGMAYGTPVGMNYADSSKDSLQIQILESDECGKQLVFAEVYSTSEYQSTITSYYVEVTDNVNVEASPSDPYLMAFTATTEDPTSDGAARLIVVMSNGHQYAVNLEFDALILSTPTDRIGPPAFHIDSTSCFEVEVSNNSVDTITIVRIETDRPSETTINPSGFTVLPGGSQVVQVCISATDAMLIQDTLRFHAECGILHTNVIESRGTLPSLSAADVIFDVVSGVGQPTEKPCIVKNSGPLPVRIDSLRLVGKKMFELKSGSYPVTLAPGENYSRMVRFVPDGREYDSLYALIHVDAERHNGDQSAQVFIERVTSVDEGNLLPKDISISPHPIIIGSGRPARVELPRNGLDVEVFDITGRLVWSTSEAPLIMTIPENVFTHSGAFVLIAKDARGSVKQTITVVE